MNKKYIWILWVVFAIYAILLLYVTLWNRHGGFADMTVAEYAARSVNLKPFKTIGIYIKWLFDGNRFNNYIPVTNLGVNLILLFPMGYFLPNLFKWFKNFFAYLGINIILLALIETIQLLTGRGSFDVDDFILNIFGAIIGFIAWKLTVFLIKKIGDSKNIKSKNKKRQ